jgi:transposase
MNTMGIDLHAKRSRYVLVSQEGNILKKGTIQSSPEAFRRAFTDFNPSQVQVALEATGNWFWAADVPEELGLQVHLANPYKVRLIAESTIKTRSFEVNNMPWGSFGLGCIKTSMFCKKTELLKHFLAI